MKLPYNKFLLQGSNQQLHVYLVCPGPGWTVEVTESPAVPNSETAGLKNYYFHPALPPLRTDRHSPWTQHNSLSVNKLPRM